MDLLNAILDSDDWSKCIELNLDHLFEVHGDIWAYVVDHVNRYDNMPNKTTVKSKFPDFELLKTTEPFEYYVDEARNHSMTQSIRANIQKAIGMLNTAGPIQTLNFLSSESSKLMKETGTLKDTNLVLDYVERVKNFEERSLSDNPTMGIPSGIKTIDEIYGGWQDGDLVILMGWTGSTKTWLSSLFAVNAWKAGYRPLIISLEMNKFQMAYRIDTILNGGIDFTNDELMNAKNLEADDYMAWAKTTFENKPDFFLVTAEGLETATQNTVRAKIEQYNPDLVILDYHGLFEDAEGSGSETTKIMNLSKAFKKLAVRYNVPIIDIAAVTLSNAKEQLNRPPELHEVAWSKQLTYDADLALALHRPDGSNVSQVVARKTRRCPKFAFYLEWDLNTGVWREKYDFEPEVDDDGF